VSKEDAQRLATAIEVAKAKVRFCDRCFNLAEADLCEICADPRRDGSVICVVEEPRDVVAVEKTREFTGTYHVLHGCINPIEGVGPDDLKVRELLARLQGSPDSPTASPAAPQSTGQSATVIPMFGAPEPPAPEPAAAEPGEFDVESGAESSAGAALGAATAPATFPMEPARVEEVIVCTNPTIEGEATAMYLARLLTPAGVSVSRLASGLPVGGDLEYADEVTLGRALLGRRQIEV